MKKVQYFIFYNLKLLERYRVYLFLISLLIILTGFVLIKWHQNHPVLTISEGMVGTFTADNLPSEVTTLLSSPLINLDVAGQPQPSIFSSWQVNQDANTYDFKLKSGLKWMDGTPVSASDIVIPVGGTQVRAIDAQNLEVKLTDSFSPLPTLLNKPAFKKQSYIGTGPYYIDRIDKNQIFVTRVVLKSGQANLPQIEIRFYANEDIADQALEIGEVKSLIEANKIDLFKSQSPFTIVSKTDYSKIVTVFYNTKDQFLADKNLRLAFSFSAPSIPGQTEAVTSLPPNSWAFNKGVKDYLDNPDQAKDSLAKVKEGKDAEFTLTSTEALEDVGKNLVDTWNKSGLKTKLKIESGVPQNFQMLLVTQDIPPDPDQYSLWHSTQSTTNVSGYSSPRVDKDLEDGRKSADLKQRLDSYQDFQKVLLDDSPATFLYFPKLNIVYLKKDQQNILPILKLQFPSLNF